MHGGRGGRQSNGKDRLNSAIRKQIVSTGKKEKTKQFSQVFFEGFSLTSLMSGVSVKAKATRISLSQIFLPLIDGFQNEMEVNIYRVKEVKMASSIANVVKGAVWCVFKLSSLLSKTIVSYQLAVSWLAKLGLNTHEWPCLHRTLDILKERKGIGEPWCSTMHETQKNKTSRLYKKAYRTLKRLHDKGPRTKKALFAVINA